METLVRFLNNQQLIEPKQVKNRESLNFVFLFSQLCKKRTYPVFSPWWLVDTSRAINLTQQSFSENTKYQF